MTQIELCLLANAAEQELNTAAQAIAQKYDLPCWLMEPMVDKLHRALVDGKAREIDMAKQQLIAEQQAAKAAQEAEEDMHGTESNSPEENCVQ